MTPRPPSTRPSHPCTPAARDRALLGPRVLPTRSSRPDRPSGRSSPRSALRFCSPCSPFSGILPSGRRQRTATLRPLHHRRLRRPPAHQRGALSTRTRTPPAADGNSPLSAATKIDRCRPPRRPMMKRPLVARASELKTCHLQLGQPVRSMQLVSAFSSLVASGPAAPAAAPQSNPQKYRLQGSCLLRYDAVHVLPSAQLVLPSPLQQPCAVSVPLKKSAIHDLQVHAAHDIDRHSPLLPSQLFLCSTRCAQPYVPA